MRLITAISIASLVVSIAAVVFVLGLYAELDKSRPNTPTSDVPLLDEKTVADITYKFVHERDVSVSYQVFVCTRSSKNLFQAEYLGKDIWVVQIPNLETSCTFTVHDKKAHVILPQ